MSGLPRILSVSLFLIISIPAFSGIGIGKWRTHYCYNNVTSAAYADGPVYAVGNGKLFSLGIDETIKTYSLLDGLNGNEISLIDWNSDQKKLIIVYSDGNIDLMSDSEIENLPDFKNKSVTADKSVYNLKTSGKYAYLSTGIGLVVIDTKKTEISDTYKPTSGYISVYDALVGNDSIILATEKGLYAGNKSDNLSDPSKWSYLPSVDGIIPVGLVEFSGHLFMLSKNGTVYEKTGSEWNVFLNDQNTFSIKTDDNYLYAFANDKFYLFDSSLKPLNHDDFFANNVTVGASGDIKYFASGNSGLVKVRNTNSEFKVEQRNIVPNGPGQIYAWNSFFKDGVYYSTTGGRWGDRYNTPGDILVYKNEKWQGLDNKENISSKTGYPFLDPMNLAIDPKDPGHFFITSWGEGLYEFRDSVFYKLYNSSNSPLNCKPYPYQNHLIRPDGAKFDSKGNLWMLASNMDTVIQILKPDGTWSSVYYPDMPNAPTWNSILFTTGSQIWFNSVRVTYGVFVLDQNGTPDDKSDDKTRWFSSFTDQDGISLSPFTINCITEDLDGNIWIGTQTGPLVANNPANVFNSDYNFTRIKIPRKDGTNSADYLLENTRINCIVVDGANRKWIGTNGDGLYLMSSDGLETIHHFTASDSPLPSDYIWSVAVNPNTGEVFIGTDAGLVSYRSDAIEGKQSYDKVYVFPNPVKPEYTGKITVTGLKENSQVKITDLGGNLIIEGTSLGGQFCWNGINRRGRRVASGVYMVFCSSEDGTEYAVCRFMVVN